MAAMSRNHIVTLDEMELGIDFMSVYQNSVTHMRRMPEFGAIYDNYKLEVMMQNTSISAAEAEKYLEAIRIDMEVERMPAFPELVILKDIELFDFLMRKRISFLEGERLYNSPVKGVW